MLRLSDPSQTHYAVHECCWRDGAGNQTLGLASFVAVARAIGPRGLAGIDTLLGLRIAEVRVQLIS